MHDQPPEDSAAAVESLPDLARRIQELQVAIDRHHASCVEELVPLVERAIGDPELEELGPRAAELLAKTKDPRAVDVLLRALEHCEPGEALLDAATFALVDMGEPVLEPALARLEAAEPDDDAVYGFLEVLSQLGIADERIFAHLVRAQGLDRCFLASCFAHYGDRRGLPHVHRMLDSLELTGQLVLDRDVLDLADAIERLGGTLTEAERRKLAAFEAARDGFRRPPKPGRNEPCWCGSGKKYKRCHEATDQDED